MPRRKSDKKKRPIAVSVIAVAIVVLFLIRLYQVFEPLFHREGGVLIGGALRGAH